jgi:glycosyltransferase involved in cell wall biosynthesis
MQLMVGELLELDSSVSVIYVEPAVDVAYSLAHGDFAGAFRGPGASSERLTVIRTRKWLPRVLGPFTDRSLARQVRSVVRAAKAGEPVLWVNDSAYARLVEESAWPTVYDVTDDWTEASVSPRARARFVKDDAFLVERSEVVVVCSPDLARTRGRRREVALIPNGVDVVRFTAPSARPTDLPAGVVLLYPGTLHEDRLDIGLCTELARSQSGATFVFVGPNALSSRSTEALVALPNVVLLGARPYEAMPGYLQHADVVVIPHRVSPFTESLDPIKAYECLAVGRPTVATPVAGFRDLDAPVVVAERTDFAGVVKELVVRSERQWIPANPIPVPTWTDRSRAFAAVLAEARTRR